MAFEKNTPLKKNTLDRKVNGVYFLNMVQKAAKKKSPRQRRRERQTREIIEASLRLTSEGGLEALTMQRLADAVDLTPGALYRYFKSKDSLLAELQSMVLHDIQQLIEHSMTYCQRWAESEAWSDDRRVLTQLLAIATIHRSLRRRWPARFRLLSRIVGTPAQVLDDELAAPLIMQLLTMLGHVAVPIAEAQSLGLFRSGSAKDRAVTMIASAQGLFQFGKFERISATGLDTEALAKVLIEDLLRSWNNTARNTPEDFAEALREAQQALSDRLQDRESFDWQWETDS